MENLPKKKKFCSENLIQIECIAWFRNQYERKGLGVIVPIPNELAAKRKDIVVCQGASDLILILKGKTLFAELKTAYNTQSIHQLEFEKKVKALGFNYKVIRSLNEFQIWLGAELNNITA